MILFASCLAGAFLLTVVALVSKKKNPLRRLSPAEERSFEHPVTGIKAVEHA